DNMALSKRQNEIVATAMNLIADGGIKNLTIKNIALELNITEPAIYRHFQSKSEIIRNMIDSFDSAVEYDHLAEKGLDGVEEFIRSRIEQALANPKQAKVMFAEELFMDDPEFSRLICQMMHCHKETMEKCFAYAQLHGEIRSDVSCEMAFRIVFGSVRLLIKQWSMSGHAFDLKAKSEELLSAIRTLFIDLREKSELMN
ncbi:MAG: TetR/AcrR family transcriptional regulator, partial [Thermoguttaceae bacterium]